MSERSSASDGLVDWQDDEGQSGHDDKGSALENLLLMLEHKLLLTLGPLLAGIIALAITYVIAPTFTARTMFVPPQQQQSAAASAIASLGTLGNLAGAAAGIRSPGEQYVALMQSTTVSDRIIDGFKLMQAYDADYRVQARKELSKNVRIALGKKDGLITVEVDDESPSRAAEIANQYVEELRELSERLVLTEAKQRRVFFEGQLKLARNRLADVQKGLQESGFSQGALKAEPKAAAEGYARLRAEVTAAEVRLGALRQGLTDTAPEVQQALSVQSAMRAKLAKLEETTEPRSDSDYISRYREFKYEEALFELFARQYELARVDESREGPLIQVVDIATPPERKSKPKRAYVAIGATLVAFATTLAFLFGRRSWHRMQQEPDAKERMTQLRQAWRGGP
jgi:uncharacterized protein involved in exopolysaccharide biosynthesis